MRYNIKAVAEMAERLNAHDSKSCYAGMYTRVQIPFSAPKIRRPFMDVLFFVDCDFERDLRVEPRMGMSVLLYKLGLFLGLNSKSYPCMNQPFISHTIRKRFAVKIVIYFCYIRNKNFIVIS